VIIEWLIAHVQRALGGVLCFLAIVIGSYLAQAQSVRPIITEYQGNARGSYEVVNPTNEPVNVVLETYSFSVDENGRMSYRSLDSNVELKLSAMSFRVAPQQTYTVFYTAKAIQVPAWFVIYTNFRTIPKLQQSGLNIQVELPHVVYLLPKKGGLQKTDIHIHSAQYDRSRKQVGIEIENTGPNVGRVTDSQVFAGKKFAGTIAGAIFPHSRRRFEMAWEQPGVPERIVLQLGKLRVEQVIVVKD
jgi:P pilus assembly chaperone PapD